MENSNPNYYANLINKIKHQPYLYVSMFREAKQHLNKKDFEKLINTIAA